MTTADPFRQSPGATRPRAAATFAASVALDDVSRSYGDGLALDRVSLAVSPGEIICLLGPSGCGKTTLLRIVSGIERPTAGRVLINGVEVAGADRFTPPEKRSVGLMFQDFALFPHLSVLDNVAFGLRALGSEEKRRAAMSILDRVGLADFAGAFPATLSGGQQQRVALARAIVPRPAVMLMDEPFSGLDVQLRDQMQEETLALLRETRATSIIVTHHPEEAMRLGDRIVVMRAGRIVQDGKAEALYEAPATLFVARMFSEINEAPARVSGGRIETAAGSFSAGGLADGAEALLCIRERAVRLEPLAAASGGLPGRIRDIRFLGDAARLDVAVEGFEGLLKARIAGPAPFTRGEEVRVHIEPSGVLAFPLERNGVG